MTHVAGRLYVLGRQGFQAREDDMSGGLAAYRTASLRLWIGDLRARLGLGGIGDGEGLRESACRHVRFLIGVVTFPAARCGFRRFSTTHPVETQNRKPRLGSIWIPIGPRHHAPSYFIKLTAPGIRAAAK